MRNPHNRAAQLATAAAQSLEQLVLQGPQKGGDVHDLAAMLADASHHMVGISDQLASYLSGQLATDQLRTNPDDDLGDQVAVALTALELAGIAAEDLSRQLRQVQTVLADVHPLP